MEPRLSLKQLEIFNLQIKQTLVQTLLNLGYGHFGGCLSITEILACLYGRYLKHNPAQPKMKQRDLLVLSKGHAGPALYTTLALKGFFDISELQTINANETCLPSHADMNKTLGIDMTTGSLGQGISCAVGMAIGSNVNVFTIVGDGELQEGQCWEAIQFAAHYRLKNLVVLVDYNKKQLDGDLVDIQYSFDLEEKFNAFGFYTQKVNGADIPSICFALEQALTNNQKPSAIILDTQKGQGIPCIEKMESNHHLRIDETIRAKIEHDLLDLMNKMERLQ